MRLNLSLLLCLLLALATTHQGVVEAKTLVRGRASQQPQQQMRVMKESKEDKPEKAEEKEDDDEEEPVVEAVEEAPDDDDEEDEEDEKEDKNAATDDDDEDEIDTPIEEGAEGPLETTAGPEEGGTTAAPESETGGAGAVETVAPTEADETVSLMPFAIMVDGGDITEDDLDMDDYLEAAIGAVSVDLVLVEPPVMGNSSRFLREQEIRFLQEATFYYEGTATFEGAAPADVNDQVTTALLDSDALTAHVDMPNITVTASPNTNADGTAATTTTNGAQSTASSDDDDGLSTTGLAIVIVAACVGGISLLIIVLVGATGPSGSTAQLK